MTKNLLVILSSLLMVAVSAEASRGKPGAKNGKTTQATKNKANDTAGKATAKEIREAEQKLEAARRDTDIPPQASEGLLNMVGYPGLTRPVNNYLTAKQTASTREGNLEAKEAVEMIERIAGELGAKSSLLSKEANRDAVAALLTQLAMVGKGTTGVTKADATRILNYGKEYLNDPKRLKDPAEVMNRIAKETVGPCKGVGSI